MSEHYFTASPAGPAEEREHSFVIRGTRHTVTTASGVFSADRLDKGTQVLLDRVPDPPESGLLLDLGCGWGPIALALADAAPGATVLAADVNERAVDLAALDDEGLTVPKRTAGRYVATDDSALHALRQEDARAAADAFIRACRALGVEREGAHGLVDERWNADL